MAGKTRLKNRFIDCAEGWKFRVKQTNFLVESDSFNHLVLAVKYHMQINNVAIPDDLEDIIDAEIAQMVPLHMRKEV